MKCPVTIKRHRQNKKTRHGKNIVLLGFFNTVDLVIFASFQFSRISRGGQIREFKNLAEIIIIIALLKKNENSRILNFVKSPKIRNSRKFKHTKISDLQ